MKINGITVSNFLGLSHFKHALSEPILFIAGGNGAGKTSLLEAVRFALTGAQPRGVAKVADRLKLVTEGAATGYVQVDFDEHTMRRAITSAKLAGDDPGLSDRLELCLDASRFASMPDSDRRKLLFALSGVKAGRDAVAEQLSEAGIPSALIDEVLPLLSKVFPEAASYAKSKAAESRAAWKAVAGENYGALKAKTWAPTIEGEAPTDVEIDDEAIAIAKHDARIMELAQAVGRVQSAMSDIDRERLQSAIERTPKAQLELDAAQAEYDHRSEEVSRLESAARGHAGHAASCPSCSASLRITSAGLTLAEDDGTETPAKARAALAEAKAAAHDAYTDLQECRRVLANCAAARTTIETLPPPPSDEDMKAPELLEEERKRLQHRRDLQALLAGRRREHENAQRDASRALAHHAMVEAWTATEALLAPEGIQATLLARALDPMNSALTDIASGSADWGVPSIGRDFGLYYGGRAYSLISESEQWRADAMFTAMVSATAGVHFLMLDRFDVLEPAIRGEAVDWLLHLTDSGLVESAIVAGTLKSKPDMGEGIDVVWLGAE